MKSTPLYFLLFISISLMSQSQATSNTSFIRKSCATTSYPKLCYYTLSPYSPQVKNNPKALATKALLVALHSAGSTYQAMVSLSKHRGLRPNVASALSDCTMAVANSAAQLQRSLRGMSQAAVSPAQKEMYASDVQTWTSAALTYEGTCLECFAGNDMNGSVKVIVRRRVGKLTQFTSIALALVKENGSS